MVEKVLDKDLNLLIGMVDNICYVSFIGDVVWVGCFVEIEVIEIKILNFVYGEFLNFEFDVV